LRADLSKSTRARIQRRADGILPQPGEVIGRAVLDRAARLRCPGLTLKTISERCRRLLHRNSLVGTSLAGGANHSRREVAAVG
jgi:hypothetical protein